MAEDKEAHQVFGLEKRAWTALTKRLSKERKASESMTQLAQRLELKGETAALGYMFGRIVEEDQARGKIHRVVEQMFKDVVEKEQCDCDECGGAPDKIPEKKESELPKHEKPSYFG